MGLNTKAILAVTVQEVDAGDSQRLPGTPEKTEWSLVAI